MKGMQTMMYIMPIMFLFIFNSYSSGLSYYYFIATLITIVQTWAIRKFAERRETIETNRTRQNETREKIQIPTKTGRNAADARTTDETDAEKEIRYYK